MTEIKIYKAKSLSGEERESVKIVLEEEFPIFDDYKDGVSAHKKNAKNLHEVLATSLPCGTYDRLLQLMLKEKQSHFVVPFRDIDKEDK